MYIYKNLYMFTYKHLCMYSYVCLPTYAYMQSCIKMYLGISCIHISKVLCLIKFYKT